MAPHARPRHRVWDVPLIPFQADLIDFLCQRKERGQCLEEPFSDEHDGALFRVNAIGPGKEVIADLHIAVRSGDAIWLADALTGDSDPISSSIRPIGSVPVSSWLQNPVGRRPMTMTLSA
jgi:hypothetical protein